VNVLVGDELDVAGAEGDWRLTVQELTALVALSQILTQLLNYDVRKEGMLQVGVGD